MPSFSRLSLTKQISSASILVILLTMFVLTAFVSVTGTRTAIQTGHAELNQQARSVQQMLDGYFKAVNLRAERQLNMLEQWMPGILTATSNMVDTNGMLLPELKVGDLPVNADHQLLDEFKNLTGTDIAFLAVHQGRVYRASTLLQKDGKSMDGSEISVDDPVTKHLLEGKDFSGLVFRAGKYYFLKTKVVLNPQGKVVAGLSLRVSLDVELEQMRQLFGDMKVGNTGGVSILRVGGQDNGGGEWMVHTKLQSKKLNEMESNSPWLQTMTQLLQVRPEQADMDVNPNNGVNEQVFVSTVESAPWEWLVIVSAPRAEFLEEAASTRNLIIFSGVLASLVCALVVYFLLRNRLQPLTEAVVVLRRVGDGDLTASVQHVLSHSENEIDMIGEAVNRTSQHMRHLIEGVDQACKELLSASESLKRQADIAIDSASQQLDAVSSMSTGVEEMHVTVSQVAQNASDAANASAEVRQQTNTGRNMVAGTVTDMSSIANQVEQSAEVVESLGKNSQQILNIVEVIRDIADRTNLLALNAAIEAARAGESGRGFAVVADEVRKLAEQTSTSTQEISATVDSILAQTNLAVDKMSGVSRSVGEGAARAKQAGLALDEIDRQIESSVTWANDIAHSTGEQQVVTERFADTVLRIHELAQRNHGASQNSDLAAREMIGLSHRLKEVVQKFKLT